MAKEEQPQISFIELQEKTKLIASLLTPEEAKQGVESKLKYAIRRWMDSAKLIIEEVRSEEQDLNISLAIEEEPNGLKKDQHGNYVYSRENEKIRKEKTNAIHKKKRKFNPYFFTDQERIKKFDQYEREELQGVFFK